jgi:hypothetical protein
MSDVSRVSARKLLSAAAFLQASLSITRLAPSRAQHARSLSGARRRPGFSERFQPLARIGAQVDLGALRCHQQCKPRIMQGQEAGTHTKVLIIWAFWRGPANPRCIIVRSATASVSILRLWAASEAFGFERGQSARFPVALIHEPCNGPGAALPWPIRRCRSCRV